ncbi:MAG TPA: group III truncated hemoglobin [Ferruginibacter sp.]|nr:group III truncated hemoglobin [Chitinophagaceae bacterium]MBK9531253.1 group III truncated hemoglobin [Chitinophagaceae bacterium]HQW93141.1 group III truncated hemoglobin [Ferruginibacter sp.]
MKPDINSRADIEKFITAFYEKVKVDATIGFIFTEVVQMNWEKHIPLIVDFWETILLDNPVYKKNAMEVHFDLNKKIPLQKEHFSSWLLLFAKAIDEFFEGKKAEMAKTRAKSIADVMFFKMENARKGI